MKNYIKLLIIYLLRILLCVLYVFKIKYNRIIFCVHEGNAYNCNPKYIFEYLYSKYGDLYEYIWCLNNSEKLPKEYNVECVNFLSIKYLYYLSTSKIIINNLGFDPFYRKRRGQLFIHTTHGSGAYKKGGTSSLLLPMSKLYYMKKIKDIRSKQTDYVISGCEKYTSIFSSKDEYNIPSCKFLPIGMPRNDIFFDGLNKISIKEKISNLYGFSSEQIVILYAPTYRGHNRNPTNENLHLDAHRVRSVSSIRFKNSAVVLYRHHIVENGFPIEGTIDVSDYQDMQELLLIADILITDYSSSIWDYSLTYKAGFLYVPDLNRYKKEMNFHTPIETWPFPCASSMEELEKLISSYDPNVAKEKIKAHHELLGSYERGIATTKICEIINKEIKTKGL